MTDENKIEAIKMQFQAILADYQITRQSMLDFRSMQGQLDNVTLAVLGAAIVIIPLILERSIDLVGIILFIPILFFAIASTQLRHERMLLVAALYADVELRPQIEKLLTRLASDKLQVPQWEAFLTRRSGPPNLLLMWLSVCTRAILAFVGAAGALGIYAFIRFSQPGKMAPFEIGLMVLNGIMLIIDLAAAFSIARQRYKYLRVVYYDKK